MSAPFRDPRPDGADIGIWPPVFDLGPALIADRVSEAHAMRTEAIHRAVLRIFQAMARATIC